MHVDYGYSKCINRGGRTGSAWPGVFRQLGIGPLLRRLTEIHPDYLRSFVSGNCTATNKQITSLSYQITQP